MIRGAARLLVGASPIAGGILTSLTNYVIGNGFSYVVTPRKPEARELAAAANEIIDDFLRDNDWPGDLDRELFQRSRVDGEYFLGLWHVGGGRVQARAIEPDQVTQPSNPQGLEEWLGARADRPGNWAFGVYSDEDDAQAIHGYYVQWSNRDQDWDYLPGGNEPIVPPAGGNCWVEHARLNVVRSVKRGLSDFFSIENNLDLARRVLRNMGEGAAVQAAIAWIQEMAPGTLQAQASSATLSRADASYTTLSTSGSRAHYVQQYDPATILKVPHGQKYLPGPLGAQHRAAVHRRGRGAVAHRGSALEPARAPGDRLGGQQQLCFEPGGGNALRQIRRDAAAVLRAPRQAHAGARAVVRLDGWPLWRCPLAAGAAVGRHHDHAAASRSARSGKRNPRAARCCTTPAS